MPATTPPSTVELIAFKAEIRQVLDILIHSLYTEREIFLREMISNASDALNRIRFEMLTNSEVLDPEAELAIRITADKESRTLSISDSGDGMTAEELETNLGTIAQSGAREFIEIAKERHKEQDLSDIIGQFGVGFYSAFMVAESITVTSRSYRKDAQAARWFSSGGETFTVTPAEKAHRGTTVEIKLKEDALEFADEYRLREIIRKHSDYIPFPIYLGDSEEQVNRQTAIWRQSPRSLEDEVYNEFYKHLTLDAEPPLARAHIVTDAPLRMYGLLYIPAKAERGLFSLRREDGLKLYSHKVLIQEYCKELLPEYYRFVQGVVDAEDLPLNVSREAVQSSALMARLKKILTGRINSTLKTLATDKEHPEKYRQFWEHFGPYIKEGIATDPQNREALYPLLRFHTTRSPEEWLSLNDYVGRMKPGQKKIYYLLGEDPRSLLRSPHLDYFRKHGYEVILFTETIDSFMLLGLQKYEGFDLQNVAAPDLELPGREEGEDETEEDTLNEEAFAQLAQRFKAQLGERIADVRASDRLSDSLARLVDPEGTLNQEMQRVYKLLERDYRLPKKVLELNPRHPVLRELLAWPAEDELSKTVIEQIYANALLIEGLHPDPAEMIPNVQRLIEAALQRVQ